MREKEEIKVGDIVKVTATNHWKEGERGTVRAIRCTSTGKKIYAWHFDGESGNWVFTDREIEKVKSKKTKPCIVVYRDGNTVTAKDLVTGEEASAVCSKKDAFDLHTGAFIAMSRLTNFDADINLMRHELKQIEGYIADIKMRCGALMGQGYKYPEFGEEESNDDKR